MKIDRIKIGLFFGALSLMLIPESQKIYCQSISNVNKVTYKLMPPERLKDKEFSKEDIEDMLKFEQAHEKVECELYYSKNKSVFSIVEQPLSYENVDYYAFIASLVSNRYYLDLDKQEKTCFEELGGEKLNVILPFKQYKWEISTETKKINNYTCYKATCSWNDFNIRGNSISVYNSEVWFTPEIPSSFGPMGLDGLPGLVLEANYGAGGIHFYVAKIEFNVENPKIKFNPPSVKYITEEEHQNRLIKEYEKMGR
ncbi:GLPGLI family protein [Flavobacterium sp. B11]|uniref:GLPGLI family protein n=1 Tax=Flavobacterium movens TaxID=214860 RepID=UPI0031D0FE4E